MLPNPKKYLERLVKSLFFRYLYCTLLYLLRVLGGKYEGTKKKQKMTKPESDSGVELVT